MPPDFHLIFKRGDLVYIPQDTVFLKGTTGTSFYKTIKPSIGVVVDTLFEHTNCIDEIYDVYVVEANDVFMASRSDIYNLNRRTNANSTNASNQGT